MSLVKRVKFPRKMGARLTIWFACLLIFCQAIFFITTYFFLFSILKNRDFEDIKHETVELLWDLETEGFSELRDMAMEEDLETYLKESLFIRVASSDNKTLFFFSPKPENLINLNVLEDQYPADKSWLTLAEKGTNFDVNFYTRHTSTGEILQFGMTSRNRDLILNKFKKLILLGFSPCLLLSLGLAAFVSYKFLKPIRNILATVKNIDEGQMDSRVARTKNNDELDELAEFFNKMLGRIELLIKGMKESLDYVAHDLRTPLTRLRNTAESALKETFNESISREAHENAIEESGRILKILENIMDITEADAGIMSLDYKRKDAGEIIYPIYDLYSYIAEDKNITIKIDISEDTVVFGDFGKISQVVANALDNAVKFTPEYGVVEIEAYEENGHTIIVIKDSGTGICEDEKEKLFNRLYRGERAAGRKGLGLGLSLVKAVVKSHNGSVSINNKLTKGSIVRIELPLK